MDTHPVLTEIVYLRVDRGGLAWRAERHPLPAGTAPDVHVRDLADPALCHSTSWRHDPVSGALVTTWVVYPDPDPGAAADRLPPGRIATGATATRPVPMRLAVDDVAVHAARHLAFLAHHDPVVTDAVHRFPGLHDALLDYDPDVAELHTWDDDPVAVPA